MLAPARYIAVDNESSLYATVYATPSLSQPLLVLSPLHRHWQEAGQRRARRSEYDMAAIAAAVPYRPDVSWRPLRRRSGRGIQGGHGGAIEVSIVAYASAAQ